jgi:hypothetical protein
VYDVKEIKVKNVNEGIVEKKVKLIVEKSKEGKGNIEVKVNGGRVNK